MSDKRDEVEVTADEPLLRQRVLGAAFFAMGVAFMLPQALHADRTLYRVLTGSSATLFAVALIATLVPTWRIFGRPRLLLSAGGWRSGQWRPPEKRSAKSYPDLPFVRVDYGGPIQSWQFKLAERVRMPQTQRWLGRTRTALSPNAGKAQLTRRFARQLWRDVEAARDVVPGARASPAMARVDGPSHCPRCVYSLAGQTTSTRCPECGWGWEPGDVVLFGRRGPTGGDGRRRSWPARAARGVAAAVGGGLFGAASVGVPMLMILWAWRSLPPMGSWAVTGTVALALLGLGTWFIGKVTRAGEGERDRNSRVGEAADGPAGLGYVAVTREGIQQALIADPEATPLAWGELDGVRVQRWPGGVRVRAEFRGKPRRWWRPRPIDFLADLPDSAAAAREVRRRVYALSDGR